MIKIFLLFTIIFLWALQFCTPRIMRLNKRNFIIEQIGMTLVFAVLVLLVIFGV